MALRPRAIAQPRGSTDQAAAIIAAYPGPVTLRAPSRKWLVPLATSVAFTAFGIQMHFDPPNVPGADIVAWSITVFFSFCALACAVMLHPAASRLTLDGKGFEVSRLFRRRRCRWHTIGVFSVSHVGSAVVYDDTERRDARAERNRKRYGGSSVLPDGYGFELDALAQMLNAWRERALGMRG